MRSIDIWLVAVVASFVPGIHEKSHIYSIAVATFETSRSRVSLRQILVAPETNEGAAVGGPGLTVTVYAGVVFEQPVAVMFSVTVNVLVPGVFQITLTV